MAIFISDSKGRELAGNPQAMMLFFWNEMHRQVRIEGRVDADVERDSILPAHEVVDAVLAAGRD